MKLPHVFRIVLWTLLPTVSWLFPAENGVAQNRTVTGLGPQNQQGGLGGGAQGSLGAGGQFGLGLRQQGLGQPGGIGPAGIQGRQGATLGQPRAGRQDGFVGSDAKQIREQQSTRDRGQRQRALFDFAIESLNEMRESRREQRDRQNQKSPVRVRLRPLFTAPQTSAPESATHVRAQFHRALPTTASRAQISVRGGTATIQGTVSSDYDKQLAAKMLSIQPGVLQVENQLTVTPGQGTPLPVPLR